MEDIEQYRREVPCMSTAPLSTQEAIDARADGLLDYASAGTKISRGMQHLDESLPIGQRRRSELAFALVKQGVEELETWMRIRGYTV